MPRATSVKRAANFGERVWYGNFYIAAVPDTILLGVDYYTDEKTYDPFEVPNEYQYRILNALRDEGVQLGQPIDLAVKKFENKFETRYGTVGNSTTWVGEDDVAALSQTDVTIRPYDVSPNSEFQSSIDIIWRGVLSGALSQNFTASRAVVFPFVPQRPITETIEYETEITEAWDGSEQRASLRPKDRITYSHNYLLDSSDEKEQVQTARMILGGNLGREVFFGMWHESAIIESYVAIQPPPNEVFAVTVEDKFYMGFRGGATKVMFWRAWDDYIVVDVDSSDFSSDNVLEVFESDVPESWLTPGTSIVELRPAIVKDNVKFSSETSQAMTVTAEWQCERSHGTDGAVIPTFTTIYDGSPVMEETHLLLDGKFPSESEVKYETKNTKTGAREFFLRKTTPVPVYRKTFDMSGEDVDTVDSLTSFLLDLKGRRTSFWFPTNLDDLNFDTQFDPFTTGFPVTSLIFRVADTGIGKYLQEDAPYEALKIVINGTTHYRKITSISTGTGIPGTSAAATDRLIQLDSTITWDSTDEVSVSFLHRSRLGSDKLQIVHRGRGDLTSQISVVGVKQASL